MATQLEQVSIDLKNLSSDVIKEITTDLTANLVEVSPVDTGWMRANWVPSIGTPLELNQPGVKQTSSQVSLRETNQQAGIISILTDYTLERGDTFVSNNVPYVQVLNGGHSKQEPAGFVERAVEKAITTDQENR